MFLSASSLRRSFRRIGVDAKARFAAKETAMRGPAARRRASAKVRCRSIVVQSNWGVERRFGGVDGVVL